MYEWVGVRVEVEVVLLDVLAVVALVAGQAEQALLEDRVAPVPQREREADPLVAVADAGEAVLVPAIGARSRVIVREVVPRGAVGAVVLADGAPGALAEVRAPSASSASSCPGLPAGGRFRRSSISLICDSDTGGPLQCHGSGGAAWHLNSHTRSGRMNRPLYWHFA